MTRRHRSMGVLGALAIATAIVACADSAGPGRDASDASQLVGTNGRGDTTKQQGDSAQKPDTTRPRPDTGQKPDSGRPKPDTGRPPVDTGRPPVDTGRPPVDTGRPPVDTGRPPVDTSRPPVDTTHDASIRGDVYGVDSTARPVAIGPLRGVQVTLFQTVREPSSNGDGRVRVDSIMTVRTGELGRFEFTKLLAGNYLLRAVPPAGSGYPTVEQTVTAWSERSLVLRAPIRIYLHKGP